MLRKIWALGIVLILCLSMGVSTQNAVEPNNVNQELEWWDVYSRDKNHDGISDLLIWKLQQGEQFYDIGEARVFVRYDHHPTDYDIQRLEDAGIEVTFRAQFIDLIGTTMSRDIIHEVASWDGIVMLDDIGKAVPDMNEAVPKMGVDQVWKNYGLYGDSLWELLSSYL